MELPLREAELNEYLDSLVDESQQAKKEPSKYWDENMRFYNGEHWQTKLPSHRIPVTANYTAVTVKRLAAMITDTKPNIEVRSHVPELSALCRDILSPTIRANWDEQSYDQKFGTGLIPKSIILGACACAVTYDNTNGPYGNISLPIIDPRALILDPAVTRAADVDSAEYSGYQTIMSLNQLRYAFGDKARLVVPDATLSRWVDRNNSATGYNNFDSPGHRVFFRLPASQGVTSYAISRAQVQEFYINDRRKVGDLPVEVQEHFVTRGLTLEDQAWPGGRQIIRAGANKKILADRANPYIDNKTPIVMYDWGLNTENPWGSSEVQLIKSLQAVLNKLASSLVENAVKMNNNIWIGDRDALEKKEWADLNDAPGLLVKVRPGRQLRRESPPALPGSVFQMIQWITNMIDMLTGLVDVTQGKRPVGLVSSNAIEALNLAAQTLIRYQARKFENFLERVGKRMIARIFQFYSSDRMIYYLGRDGAWKEYAFKRQQILDHMVGERPFNIFRDLDLMSFLVTPGSSMAITRVQKGQLSMGLYSGGLIPGYQVLQSVEWDNPRDTVNEARQERMMGMQTVGEPQNTKRTRVAA